MAEQRVSGLFAAICALAALVLAAAISVDSTAAKGKLRLDTRCRVGGGEPAGDGRGGDARLTDWTGSPYLHPHGVVRAVMLFVDFADAEGGAVPTPAIEAALTDNAKGWLDDVSYDRAKLVVSAQHQWLRMPKASTSYWPPGGAFQPTDYINDAITAADSVVDFSGAEIVYIVPAPGSQIVVSPAYTEPRRRADGTALNRFVTFGQHIYGDPARASRTIQGTAHLFSLPYLNDPGQAGAPGQRWAGGWDPMGEPELLAHPNAWSKRKLGWLRPGRSMLCIRRGTVTEELVALSRRRGLRAISVRISNRRRYVIEARRRRGFDAGLCSEGVLVWLIDGARGSGDGPMRIQPARGDSENPARSCRAYGVTGALDRAAFEPGREFADRKTGVTVAVEKGTRRGYVVRVTATG